MVKIAYLSAPCAQTSSAYWLIISALIITGPFAAQQLIASRSPAKEVLDSISIPLTFSVRLTGPASKSYSMHSVHMFLKHPLFCSKQDLCDACTSSACGLMVSYIVSTHAVACRSALFWKLSQMLLVSSAVILSCNRIYRSRWLASPHLSLLGTAFLPIKANLEPIFLTFIKHHDGIASILVKDTICDAKFRSLFFVYVLLLAEVVLPPHHPYMYPCPSMITYWSLAQVLPVFLYSALDLQYTDSWPAMSRSWSWAMCRAGPSAARPVYLLLRTWTVAFDPLPTNVAML